jgi:hypothetical protein
MARPGRRQAGRVQVTDLDPAGRGSACRALGRGGGLC